MKLFVLVIAALLAFANADVSHLFNGDHHHHHDHHHHEHHHEHHDHHDDHHGYSYDQPSIPFELPKSTYLPPPPPEPPTTPTPTYLPPEKPAPTYLPPKTTRAPPPPPPPPRPTYAPAPPPPPPPPTPKNEYLPPQQQQQQHFEIPLPSYADAFLEPDSPHLTAAAQPESTYLPPEPVAEHSDDGYHYDPPAKRFRF